MTVVVNLGFPPFTYAWSTNPVQTTATITGLTAGTYSVTVTDSEAMTGVSSATVTEPYTFEKLTGSPLQQVTSGTVNWGDYDNDNDLDFVLTGLNSSNTPITRIYKSSGGGIFIEQTGISMTGVRNSSAAWEDYDNDGDLDLLVAGNTGSQYLTKLYRNNGNNTFTQMTGISLSGVAFGSVGWGDYNNDGKPDILLSGYTGTSHISKVYKNNGANTFSEQTGFTLTGVSSSSVAWDDYDTDGFQDILIAGNNGSFSITAIYRNNGDNTFTEQTGIGLPGISSGSVSWGDYNNDGNPDILLTGLSTSLGRISRVYVNNGNNIFSQLMGAGLTGLSNGSAAWGDYDNDGLLDILLTGSSDSFTPVSKVYRNNGNGTFSEVTGLPVSNLLSSAVAWGDYDNDNDLDFLLAGSSSGGAVTDVYTNRLCNPNTPPLSPGSLATSLSGYDLTLTWNKATDTQTAQDGLTYNVYMGNTPGTVGKKSPMAGLSDGYRRVVQFGNTGQVNSYTLKGLSPGTYYWGVQSLDNCFAGSPFATGSPVVVPFMSLTTVVTDVSCRGENDGAIDLSVNNGAVPYTYLWDNGDTTEDVSGLIAATYQVTVTDQHGYSAVTSATVGEVDMPCDTTVSNLTITSGQTVCYDAVQILTIAGGGSNFTVENGGNVTLIAGQAIFLLPNTTVYVGGYMHAYITTNGEFCNPAGLIPRVADPKPAERDDKLIVTPSEDAQSLFSIYPNPTDDYFTLELIGISKDETVMVEIFNMTGERITRETLTGQLKYRLSLGDHAVGIYVIHVIAGDNAGSAKIIKR
jgi:hypothetical protein